MSIDNRMVLYAPLTFLPCREISQRGLGLDGEDFGGQHGFWAGKARFGGEQRTGGHRIEV